MATSEKRPRGELTPGQRLVAWLQSTCELIERDGIGAVLDAGTDFAANPAGVTPDFVVDDEHGLTVHLSSPSVPEGEVVRIDPRQQPPWQVMDYDDWDLLCARDELDRIIADWEDSAGDERGRK